MINNPQLGDLCFLPMIKPGWSDTAIEWVNTRKVAKVTRIESSQIWLNDLMCFYKEDISSAKRKITIII